MEKLTEHFYLEEFTTSQTAERLGIVNNPPREVLWNLKILCEKILEPARQALGPLKISSGYRCNELNIAVNGSKNSDHKYGWAADVIPLKVSKMELAKWIRENCEFDQIILEFGTMEEPAWVHVSCSPRNRGEVLRTLKMIHLLKWEGIFEGEVRI